MMSKVVTKAISVKACMHHAAKSRVLSWCPWCEHEAMERAVMKLKADQRQLIDAVVAAYRKHHRDDENIGWNELTTILSNAGANALGDGEWLARVGAEDVGEW